MQRQIKGTWLWAFVQQTLREKRYAHVCIVLYNVRPYIQRTTWPAIQGDPKRKQHLYTICNFNQKNEGQDSTFVCMNASTIFFLASDTKIICFEERTSILRENKS